ncbi:MAG: type 1 glutamine amidotransferase [Desulfovibrio sp.]|jgi:protease I|nr:type 1 glutamine amidotransferase [Desulfovibrio sp.]
MQMTGPARVVVFLEELYNELEFWYPKLRLVESGASVTVAGPEAGAVCRSKVGLPATADVAFEDVDPAEVDGLVIPGGYAPDRIRRNSAALEIVRNVHQRRRPLAFICHAGWVPVSAGILQGRTVTSYHSIRDDLVNAGATWVDKPLVVDGHLVSSRTPEDLPAFCAAFLNLLATST